MNPYDHTLIWHVVFHPGKSLWSKRYRHVSLAGFANDTWLHLDLQSDGVSVATIHQFDEVNDYLSLLLAHYTVLRFGPARDRGRFFLHPMTCVSFVKHVLGVRSGALRPEALLRDLLRDYSAEVLSEAENTAGNAGTEATAYYR